MNMNVEQIITEIKNGMTGVADYDIEYLIVMAKKYSHHEKFSTIIKAIFDLMISSIPENEMENFQDLLNGPMMDVMLGLFDALELEENNRPEEALTLLENLIEELENLYVDTDHSEWHYFESPLQHILFEVFFKKEKEVKVCEADFSSVYRMYGDILKNMNRYEEAIDAYKKALMKNPFDVDALISQVELLKKIGHILDANMLIYKGLYTAYTPEALSGLYKLYGKILEDRKNTRKAYYSYYLASIYNEKDTSLVKKMENIQNKRKRKMKELSLEELDMEFGGFLQIGPNEEVCEVLLSCAEVYEEIDDYVSAMEFYDCLYNLTGNQEIWEKMEKIYNQYLDDGLKRDPSQIMS